MGAGEGGKSFGESACRVSNVALQHGRTRCLELVNEGFNNIRMIMPGIVDAVAGKKVEENAPILGV